MNHHLIEKLHSLGFSETAAKTVVDFLGERVLSADDTYTEEEKKRSDASRRNPPHTPPSAETHGRD
jgi:hypothetical protein